MRPTRCEGLVIAGMETSAARSGCCPGPVHRLRARLGRVNDHHVRLRRVLWPTSGGMLLKNANRSVQRCQAPDV